MIPYRFRGAVKVILPLSSLNGRSSRNSGRRKYNHQNSWTAHISPDVAPTGRQSPFRLFIQKQNNKKKTIEPDWSKFIEVQRKGKSIHQHPQIVKLDLV